MLAPIHRWSSFVGAPLRTLDGGLINTTLAVGDPEVAVLQRLHPIFRPEVNLDIDVVTRHLAAAGFPTPRLIRSDGGEAFALDEEGRCWRALTWVPGRTIDRVTDPSQAFEAGALVGRWHRATADLEHVFHFRRAGVHDTGHHVRTLLAAVDEHRSHRLHAQVAPAAEALAESFRSLPDPGPLPARITHGDLKISNLRFDEAGRGHCLLDLDTIGHQPIDAELGDALRSWCNRAGEDSAEARFDPSVFEASAAGWIGACDPDQTSREALPLGLLRISLELAARFLADALAERYFGWNPALAPARGEHNLLRGLGQWDLHLQVRSALPRLRAVVSR